MYPINEENSNKRSQQSMFLIASFLCSFLAYFFAQKTFYFIYPIEIGVSSKVKFKTEYTYHRVFTPPIINMDFTYKFKPYSKDKCLLCNYSVRNQEYADSTEKDLLIVAGIGSIRNLAPLLRTLRTTGSKCGVVLLTDDDAKIDPITQEIAENCGLQIYRCGKYVPPPGLPYAPYAYVYYLINAFLEQNKNNLGRVILVDLFDTVFQGDPFNVQVNDKYINAVDEGLFFLSSELNRQWYSQADWLNWPKLPLSKYLRLYICSGYFAGTAKDISHLMNVFVDFYDFTSNAPDQGVFNYLFFAKSKEYGLKKSPFRKKELVHHTIACKKCREKHHRVIGKIPQRWNSKQYASVVHHYYKSKMLSASILFACPRLPGQLGYLPKLSENEINELEKNYTKAILDD